MSLRCFIGRPASDAKPLIRTFANRGGREATDHALIALIEEGYATVNRVGQGCQDCQRIILWRRGPPHGADERDRNGDPRPSTTIR
jgi:hypothetical protein